MKAIRIHRFGGPEVVQLDEIDTPLPQSGDLLLRVAGAAINPVDNQMREGKHEAQMPHVLPLTLGCDVAGTVEAIGPGTEGFAPGDSVYAYLDLRRLGAFANYAIVKIEEAAHSPTTLDPVHAASVPVAALTAYQALFDNAGLERGQTVLIHAASGGVGSMAVQLAKWKGARVIGTASENNLEYLAALGVDEAIDYKSTPFESVVHDVDVVFDTIGGDTQERSFSVLKPGGFLISVVSPPPQRDNVRSAMMSVKPNGKRLVEVAKLVDEGVLKTLVETVFPLEETARGLALSASANSRGKIGLRID